MLDLFPPFTIFLMIALQLFIVGVFDSFKPDTRSKAAHFVIMWIIMIVSILFTACFVRAIVDLTWDDFTIIDSSYKKRGIMLRTVLIPVIPVSVMLVYWSIFCEPSTKIPHINLSILYLFGVTLMFIHMAFPSVL